MKFKKSKLQRYQTLKDTENEVFTKKEIQDIHIRANRRSRARHALSKSISDAVSAYMSKEEIGFNELTRRLEMSSATTAKVLRGDANLTLETLVLIAQVIGREPCLVFKSLRGKSATK